MKFKSLIIYLGMTTIGVTTALYHPYLLSHFNSNYVGQYPAMYPDTIDETLYPAQTKNNCGPYVVATMIQLFKAKDRNPEYVVEKMNFRLPEKFTLPLGIKDYLIKEKFKTKELNLLDVSREKKIQILKYNLSKGRKIVTIIHPTGAAPLRLHYVLILGYDEENFHIYDPGIRKSMIIGYTQDRNGDLIGNKSLKLDDLISQMNNGHVFGVAKDYTLLTWR
jgi:hypothetical protein